MAFSRACRPPCCRAGTLRVPASAIGMIHRLEVKILT